MIQPSRRSVLAAAVAGGAGVALSACAPSASVAPGQVTATPPTTTPHAVRATRGFDRKAHSIDEDSSLWIVVNKRRPLEGDFVPSVVTVPVAHTNPPLLRAEASAAVVALFAAARQDGVLLASNSTYRSFVDQRSVYDGNLRLLGKARADRLTAHPGCSEHQTGLAIDIGAASGTCSLDVCMGDRPEGRWLAAHAWRYGFLLRYPSTKVAVTGYQYEPWHFRYLGTALAAELHRTRVATLEEFFGLPAAPDYA